MRIQRDTNAVMKEMIKSLLGGKCDKCGNTTRLEVHHIDGDWRNNQKENLVLLCKNCHGVHHGIVLREFYNPPEQVSQELSKSCPYCCKVIKSLYKNQFDSNYDAHILSHKLKDKKRVENEHTS